MSGCFMDLRKDTTHTVDGDGADSANHRHRSGTINDCGGARGREGSSIQDPKPLPRTQALSRLHGFFSREGRASPWGIGAR